MKRLSLAEGVLLLAVAWAVWPSEATAATKPGNRDWTVMIFMNGKNTLEPDVLDNFHSMAEVGSSGRVSFVAEVGRPRKHYTHDDGNWSGVYRFFIGRGSEPIPEQSVFDVAKAGETVDMGNPASLRSFIHWGKATYPARHYAVIIWNHGQGWRLQFAGNGTVRTSSALASGFVRRRPPPVFGGFRAVSSDDDFHSLIYNSEVADVIGGEFVSAPLDLLGFDACLMAMTESAYAFAPHVNMMVASEEVEPGPGWRYSTWMAALAAKPDMSVQQLSDALVDSYKAGYGDASLTTMSAINLFGFERTAKSISAFADSIRAGGQPELNNILAARHELRSYGASEEPPLRTSVDLVDLLSRYEHHSSNAALKQQSAALRAALVGHIKNNYASTRSASPASRLPYGSTGLAIYFPESRQAFEDDDFHEGYLKSNRDRPVRFVQNETWAELLYAALRIK